MRYEAELAFAQNLAGQAKDIAQKYYKTKLEYITKADKSPVTIADETINQMVIDAVQKSYPDHGVLGEEQSWQLDKTLLWVCDPIDGTVAFSMGEPTFMFSIALVDNGLPVMALTCDLTSGDVFHAVKDGGAYCNNEPMHVSDRTLQQAWLAFPTNIFVLTQFKDMYEQLATEAYQTMMIHGMVFKGMLIAQGLCDAAAWPGNVKPWDAAAVKLIVEEAGGKLTNAAGEAQRFDDVLIGGMVMSNGAVHADMLQIVKMHKDSKKHATLKR